MIKNHEYNTCKKLLPHFLVIISLYIIGILVYYKAISKGVFLFDDLGLVLHNPLIKSLSNIGRIFTTHLFHGSGAYSNFYRPVQSLSLMLDYYLWGLNPFGYHLTNVLVHILCAISVYYLIYLISKQQWTAIIAGLLFCVHTVLSGSVNYISAKADLLSALFFVAALILYILHKEIEANKYRVFLFLSSTACFILAILSKEVAAICPFILLLYLYCFSKREIQPKRKSPNLVWVFFVIVVTYALLRATVLNFTGGRLIETTTGKFPLYIRLLTTSKAFMIYLRLLFFPVGLHMEWNIKPASSLFQDEVFLSVSGFFIIVIFAYYLLRTSKLKFFALGWFFITLFPYSNIFPLAYFMGEGWLYLPSIGFFALIAIYLSELGKKSRSWSLVTVTIVFFAAAIYGFLTFKRAEVWSDPVKLYREILTYSPDSTKARVNLGTLLAESGSYDEAISMYKELTELAPDAADAHAGLGSMFADKNMYDKALKEFERAVELDPNDYVAHMNIGIIYKKKGDFKKAEEKYKESIKINPNYALSYNNLGNIYLETGRYDESIVYYKKAIELSPDLATCYANLAKAYKNKGMRKEARKYFKKALELDPHSKDAIEGLTSLNYD